VVLVLRCYAAHGGNTLEKRRLPLEPNLRTQEAKDERKKALGLVFFMLPSSLQFNEKYSFLTDP
jgi:hypothetical protein